MDAGRVLVRAAVTLVDPEHLLAAHAPEMPQGISVGEVVAPSAGVLPGTLVTAVGPLAEVAELDRAGLRALDRAPGADAAEMAVRAFCASLGEALAAAEVQPGESVLVSGGGLTARLAGMLTERLTGARPFTMGMDRGSRQGRSTDNEVGVLIDATADPARWDRSLPLVQQGGRALFLVPPWPTVVPFDFYPHVHRRSLTLWCRRVPSVAPEGDAAGCLADPLFLRTEDLVIEVTPQAVPGLLPAGAVEHGGGKGLLVRW